MIDGDDAPNDDIKDGDGGDESNGESGRPEIWEVELYDGTGVDEDEDDITKSEIEEAAQKWIRSLGPGDLPPPDTVEELEAFLSSMAIQEERHS